MGGFICITGGYCLHWGWIHSCRRDATCFALHNPTTFYNNQHTRCHSKQTYTQARDPNVTQQARAHNRTTTSLHQILPIIRHNLRRITRATPNSSKRVKCRATHNYRGTKGEKRGEPPTRALPVTTGLHNSEHQERSLRNIQHTMHSIQNTNQFRGRNTLTKGFASPSAQGRQWVGRVAAYLSPEWAVAGGDAPAYAAAQL